MTEERRSLHIDWVQMAAGALAAVSSAVLLSTVGVAGTLIGAAVGSVVVTTGNAVYSHYLALSRERVAAAKASAFVHARQTGSAGGRSAGDRPAEDVDGEAEEPAKVSWREAVSGLPWKRIAPVAAGIFVLALGAILAFELVTGRAVSTYTGGSQDHGHARTSIPGLGGGGSSGSDHGPTPQPTVEATQSTSPAPTVAEPEPTTPQPSAAATSQAPQQTPTPTATSTPTTTASATPKPSATPKAPALAPATPSAP